MYQQNVLGPCSREVLLSPQGKRVFCTRCKITKEIIAENQMVKLSISKNSKNYKNLTLLFHIIGSNNSVSVFKKTIK